MTAAAVRPYLHVVHRDAPDTEEQHAAALNRNGYALVVREESQEGEWPYPGFSKELAGLKAGESKVLKHKYPKDHPDESLQGKTVEFAVEVKSVRAMQLPELDDEFAKTTGQFDTLEQLKEALSKDLEARSKSEYDDDYHSKIIEKINRISYPSDF